MHRSATIVKRDSSASGIGTMRERSLHAALKQWCSQPGDRQEVVVDGFHIDIVRDDLLIEIQTRNFSTLKRKLAKLTERHRVRLVHPIASEKWIVKLAKNGLDQVDRRKSPKHGDLFDVFDELVSLPELIAHPNFSLEVLIIREEEVRRKHAARRWRRGGWGTYDRRLLGVLRTVPLTDTTDFRSLLPPDIGDPFTTAELAIGIGRHRQVAQKMAYCLRKMGVIDVVGKRGNAILYTAENRTASKSRTLAAKRRSRR
ncbi:MAG: hypothetical protein JXQ73_18070 [Phycisphaerae bacterium]|nr:hypothetical protein [Phycisphaerae bacterium]